MLFKVHPFSAVPCVSVLQGAVTMLCPSRRGGGRAPSAQGQAIPSHPLILAGLAPDLQLHWQFLVVLAADQNATAVQPSWHKSCIFRR